MQKNRYQIPSQPDKIVFSQSWLSTYFECPLKFKLAGEHSVSWDSEATRMGNIFERLVLGDFDGKLGEYSYGETAKTQVMIQKCADDFLSQVYEPSGGTIQEKIVIDMGRFGLGGQLDHIGQLIDGSEPINDIKFCKSPVKSTFYNPLSESKGVTDVLQPIVYPYLVFKKYGELVPFRRIVVSPLGETTNVWVKEFRCDTQSFIWLEQQLNTIYDQYVMGFLSAADEESGACYNRSQGACKYLGFCQTGKSRIFSKDIVNVNEVLGIEELAY